MSNLWDKFDKAVDVKGLAEDVKNAAENRGDYPEVPHGNYEVEITKLELVASKKGDPMVTIWFKILTGEHKGSFIFMNQLICQGFQIHIVNELLRSMVEDIDIDFVNYNQYGGLLMDVFEAICGHLEFALEYMENNKGYNTFTINEVFEVE